MSTITDEPLSKGDDDALGRDGLAKLIANGILNSPDTYSCVYAITGDWGSGKSTLGNFVIEHLNGKARVIRLNPWMINNTAEFMQDLFKELLMTLGIEDPSLNKKIGSFLKKIASAGSSAGIASTFAPGPYKIPLKAASVTSTALKKAGEAIENELTTPLRDQRDQICMALQKAEKSSKPTLVVVDDLDRMDAEEIKNIFRAIKLCADFPNLHYLLLFDSKYVEAALGYGNNDQGRRFMEKIVLSTFSVPFMPTTKACEVFLRINHHLLASSQYSDNQFSDSIFAKSILAQELTTLRAVKRFSISIQVLSAGMIDDHGPNFDLCDLCCIELLRSKYPEIYAWLQNFESVIGSDVAMMYMYASLREDKKPVWVEAFESLLPLKADAKARVYQVLGRLRPDLDFRTGKVSEPPSDWITQPKRFYNLSNRQVYFGYDSKLADLPEAEWQTFAKAAASSTLEQLDWAWINSSEQDGKWQALCLRVINLPTKEKKIFLKFALNSATRAPEEYNDWFYGRGSKFSRWSAVAERILASFQDKREAKKALIENCRGGENFAVGFNLLCWAMDGAIRNYEKNWLPRKQALKLESRLTTLVEKCVKEGTLFDLDKASEFWDACLRIFQGDRKNALYEMVQKDSVIFAKYLNSVAYLRITEENALRSAKQYAGRSFGEEHEEWLDSILALDSSLAERLPDIQRICRLEKQLTAEFAAKLKLER